VTRGHAQSTGDAFVHSFAVDLEESALIGVRPAPWLRSSSLGWLRSEQAVDVALELSSGQTAAAPDVDRAQVTSLHEGVHGRAADAQQPGGLLGSEQQRLVGPSRSKLVRCGHHFSSDLVAFRTPTTGGTSMGEGANFGRLVTAAAEQFEVVSRDSGQRPVTWLGRSTG
jgi:hypothetical protein